MDLIETLSDAARARPARVVFPEADEARIVQAMAHLRDRGLCVPVTPPDTASDAALQALIDARGVKEPIARRMLSKPLFRAAAMVAAGEADAMVAGVATPTRRVIEAAGIAIGLRDGVRIPSSFFLMRFPDGRQMIWADCGLNVDPTAEDLADIARASAISAKALLGRADVALLSFSTDGSGAGPSVDKVRTAAEMTGFAGPLQADAALNPRIASQKGVKGGESNVLVFPDLDAGNIAYKLAQELAGAQALGPILQGFRRPVCDLSRGAGVDDIVASTLVTLALG